MTYTEALLVLVVIYLVAKSCSAEHDNSFVGRFTTGIKQSVDKVISYFKSPSTILPSTMKTDPVADTLAPVVANIVPTANQLATTVKTAEETFLGQSMGMETMDIGSYLNNPFGAAGATFKDWMTSQAVDISTIRYHDEFIKDRIGNKNTQNVLGRTYSPDQELDSDQIHWIGIRGRPQAVKTDNPTQVPDVNYDWFANKSKLTWNSSGL